MPNLDRFSQQMPWEWVPIGQDDSEPVEKPILCACGCNQEIWLDDETSYVSSIYWEDEFIISEPFHIKKYEKREKDQLVGSRSM